MREFNEEAEKKILTTTNPSNEEYGEILALKYYKKLFKEYAIIDLSKYKTGEIGVRWRTRKEVISGKGANICANK